MNRRSLIRALSTAAALPTPTASRAWAADPPIVGLLRSSSNEGVIDLLSAFRQGLMEIGYRDRRDAIVEYHSGEGHRELLPRLVGELIQRGVAVIVGNSIVAMTAKAMTRKVPIVFASGYDPVREGLVSSISRPGGNVTGVTFLNNTLTAKQLELLHDLKPSATIGILVDTSVPAGLMALADAKTAATALNIRFVTATAETAGAIDLAFGMFAQQQVGAIAILGSAFFFSRRDHIVSLGARYSVPMMYENRAYVSAGGLMSYGGSISEAYRQAGNYAGRILKGANPGELPVVQSLKVELSINLRTARSLGVTMSPILIARADEVIE